MLSKKVQDALNDQLNAELYSAYLYLAMAGYFESMQLKGFSNWMRVQFQEEQFHAMKFFDYIISRGGQVNLLPVDAPPDEWNSPLETFQATLTHERMVTGRINDLVSLARAEKDNASEIFLQWFVNEQVEEEDNAGTILGKLQLVKASAEALFMLDKELALRVFTPPALEAGA